jgi:predicted negative regulator of RcsB-dependent stress response
VAEHLTRKELLKTDRFSLTAEHAADYFGAHRMRVFQAAGAVVLAALLGVGVYFWMQHAAGVRRDKLASALQVQEAPVGPAAQPGAISFPTQDAKDAAVSKAFSEIAAQYNGSHEGAIAEYTLAGLATDAGRNDEARKRYQAVIDSGSKEYASLAKLSLAQLDFAENKNADGEKLLRDLVDHPTALVSKDQAALALVHQIAKTRPAEAHKLIGPILSESGEVGQIAAGVNAEIPK